MSHSGAVEVPFHRAAIGEKEVNEVVDSLRSGWLTTGPKVREFENRFAGYIGGGHATALNSCTAGLHLALEALGVRRGDGVLVPTLTFAATAEVVRYLGAEPVFVDCRPDDLNLDVDQIDEAISGSEAKGNPVRAIVPVHYGGQMVDMAAVETIARRFGLKIVEDAAHCCPSFFRAGPECEWEPVGSRSDVAAFSFYANKTITTGEGGMTLTGDEKISERIRLMSLHGMSKDAWNRYESDGTPHYDIVAPGYKYNMTDLAAAIGLHQLAKADDLYQERKRIAGIYREHFAAVEGVQALALHPDRKHSWHLFVLRIDPALSVRTRDQVIFFLKELGIGSSIHWRPLHMQTYYKNRYRFRDDDFPEAHRAFQEILTIPLYPGMTDRQITAVCEAVETAVRT